MSCVDFIYATEIFVRVYAGKKYAQVETHPYPQIETVLFWWIEVNL